MNALSSTATTFREHFKPRCLGSDARPGIGCTHRAHR